MKKLAAGVLVFVGIAGAAVFLLCSSDEEKIEKMLRDCGDAAQKGDPEGVIRHLDPACTMGEAAYPALCERIRRQVKEARGATIDLGVSSHVGKDEAEVDLKIRARALQHEMGEGVLKLKVVRKDGEWRILRVEDVR